MSQNSLKSDPTLQPIAAYMLGSRFNAEKIYQEISESGIHSEFFSSETQLELLLQNPRVFVIFIDLDAAKNISSAFLAKMKTHRCEWVIIGRNLKMQQSQSIFAAGASDILQHPVHLVTLKSRTRLMLIRYLKMHDLPGGTILPHGILPRGAEESSGTNNMEHDNTGDVILIPGNSAAAKKDRSLHHHNDPQKSLFLKSQPSSEKISIQVQRSTAPAKSRNTSSQVPGAATKQTLHQSTNSNHSWNTDKIPPSPLSTSVRRKSTAEYQAAKTRMLQNTVLLTHARAPTVENWPLQILQNAGHTNTQSVSAQEIEQQLRETFSQTVDVLGAIQMLLLSLKPHTLSLEMPPNRLYALIHSSDPLSDKERSIHSDLLPQIEISLEKSNPIAVNDASPREMGQHARPAIWCTSEEEEASVVLPLYENGSPFAVILIQFKDKIEAQSLRLLEEATYVLGQKRSQCLMIDYFSRVYRDAIF